MSSMTYAPATQVSSRTGLTPFLFGDSTVVAFNWGFAPWIALLLIHGTGCAAASNAKLDFVCKCSFTRHAWFNSFCFLDWPPSQFSNKFWKDLKRTYYPSSLINYFFEAFCRTVLTKYKLCIFWLRGVTAKMAMGS